MWVPSAQRFLQQLAIGVLGVVAATIAPSQLDAEWLLPLNTETASTLPSGTAEVQLGMSYFNDGRFPPFTGKGALRSQDVITGPQFGLRVAVGSWAEVQATYEFIYLDEKTTAGVTNEEYGGGDLRLFAKFRVLKETEWRPVLGFRFGTKLPNASKSKRLGTDETDFFIEALGSKDFGVLSAHVNLGLGILGNPGPVLGAPDRGSSGQDDLFTYSAGLVSRSFDVSTEAALAIRLLADVSGWAGSRFGNDRSTVRIGLQLQRGGLTAYAGAIAGIASGSPDVGASGGLIYAFSLDPLAELLDAE